MAELDLGQVVMLKNTGKNPATTPELTEALITSVDQKSAAVRALLLKATQEFGAGKVTFANSFGAEDMVLTDIILNHNRQHSAFTVDIFSLDTGRLPAETYALMAEVEQHYQAKLSIYFPQADSVEKYVNTYGINAFYTSTELRKACCHMRKVAPLQRALAGKSAWITGMRAEQAATRTNLPTREFDSSNQLEKFNPLSDWTEKEVWAYIRQHSVPYNKLHDQFYPSIGCAPCTRAVAIGEDVRAGRWWWEDPNSKECGLHVKK